MSMLDLLAGEVQAFEKTGSSAMENLLKESDHFLDSLKGFQRALQEEVRGRKRERESESGNERENERETVENPLSSLDKLSEKWYRSSIGHLKSYNGGIHRLSKNIFNSAFVIELDDAYTFPLSLSSVPEKRREKENEQEQTEKSEQQTEKEKSEQQTEKEKSEQTKENHFFLDGDLEMRGEKGNRWGREIGGVGGVSCSSDLLIKSIITHLLKIGQCDVVPEIAMELSGALAVDEAILGQFRLLKTVVEQITTHHELSGALDWFHGQQFPDRYNAVELRFHLLQFVLLLKSKSPLHAYLYAKEHFSPFFEDCLEVIAPLVTLLVVSTQNDAFLAKHVHSAMPEFFAKLKGDFSDGSGSVEGRYVAELLDHFDDIDAHQALFANLANDFIAEFCKALKLSNDSSLFRALLAGYVYLPSFYKYRRIQTRMRSVVAEKQVDLPFQLPDQNRFLFSFHPIFICPISKEQLVPSGGGESPLVVLNLCQHVALRESVWQLSNKGVDTFKCHYCYKSHKYEDVSEGYFIDL